jgi:hypothetical protein
VGDVNLSKQSLSADVPQHAGTGQSKQNENTHATHAMHAMRAYKWGWGAKHEERGRVAQSIQMEMNEPEANRVEGVSLLAHKGLVPWRNITKRLNSQLFVDDEGQYCALLQELEGGEGNTQSQRCDASKPIKMHETHPATPSIQTVHSDRCV